MLDALPATRLDVQANANEPACYCNSPGWCVAHTHPQAERWADTNLRRSGYVTYLPLYAAQVRDRAIPSLRHTVIRPLFTGYIFVQHHRGSSWRPIYETPGVHSLIRSGSQLQYAPDAAVEALQASEAVRRLPVAVKPSWAPGMPVVVSGGAACGFKGVIVELRGDRATVMLMMLGALRRADIGLGNLVAPVVD